MPTGTYDVVGVGNAIVDVIANVDDDFLVEHDLKKGSMTLIDTERAKALYEDMPPGIETSGGLRRQHPRRGGVLRRSGGVHRQGPRRPAR